MYASSGYSYHEYVGNMHMHTPYSDGEGSHVEIARTAQQAGLDFVIVTICWCMVWTTKSATALPIHRS
jgi:hypothetical protein